jgi:muramidase (phage lysozyme)
MNNEFHDIRVYAEGVQIPAYAVTRTVRGGKTMKFTIRIPPIPSGFRVLPNTLVQIFVRRQKTDPEPLPDKEDEEDELQDRDNKTAEWVMFAEGRVKTRNIKSGKHGNLSTYLRCEGFRGDWDEVSMGFDIGQKRGLPQTRENHLFFGFSSGEGTDEEIFDGFDAGRVGATLEGLGSYSGNYQSFFYALQQMMEKGPVKAAVGLIAGMPRFSPLFRRRYLALNTHRRIGFVENKRIIKWLQDRGATQQITQRMRSMPASTTLADVINMFMKDSKHKWISIPSPTFHAENLEQEKKSSTNEKDQNKGPKILTPSGTEKGDTEEKNPWKTWANYQKTRNIATLYNDPRVKSYLDVIARSEFAGVNIPKNKQYQALYGAGQHGGDRYFSDFDDHPFNKEERDPFDGPSGSTTAAGRYQIQKSTWNDKTTNNWSFDRFDSTRQDLFAVLLILRSNAMKPLLNGKMGEVNDKVSNIWASIPAADGKGHYEEQSDVPYGHEDITKQQNKRIKYWLNKLGGKAPAATYNGDVKEEVQSVEQVAPSTAFMPDFFMQAPPKCNIIFPNQVEDFEANESFKQAVTRIMMRSGIGLPNTGRKGANTARKAARDKAYAPRKLDFLLSKLSDYKAEADSMTPKEREKMKEEIKQATVNVEDIDEETKKDLKRAAKKRRQRAFQNDISSDDILSSVLAGDTEAEGNLLSIYSLDELFRGLHPYISQFPFLRVGDAPDSDDADGSDSSSSNNNETGSEGAKIEKEIRDQVAKNFDVLKKITPMDNDAVQNDVKTAAEDSKKISEKERNLQTVTAESIYANYAYMKIRRQPRRMNYTGPLNLDLAANFTGAIFHPALGWATGVVREVTDVIDVQNQTASTSAQFSHCRFMTDLENEVWRHIEMAADAEASTLNDAGLSSNPVFYEDRFRPEKVGESTYQPLLGVDSIWDWAKENMDEEPNSLIEVLNELYNTYDEQPKPNFWRKRKFRRRIIREKEFFEEVLGVEKNGEDWVDTNGEKGSYHVYDMPDEDEAFMKERMEWAKEYRENLRGSNHAIDASFGSSSQLASSAEIGD